MRYLVTVLSAILLCSCTSTTKKEESPVVVIKELSYAKGFQLTTNGEITVLEISRAFAQGDQVFRYALLKKGQKLIDATSYDAVISVPIQQVVVTSTTHIPSLEMLGVGESLIGFPGTDYVSSTATRNRIDRGLVREVGQSESLNTEVLLELEPDAIVAFGTFRKSRVD